MDKIKKYIAASPLFKTIVFFISVILSGILVGAFLTEITSSGIVYWQLFYESISFYLILLYLFIIYLYNRFIYNQEKKIRDFLDTNYCKAYVISECLPELTEKLKKYIREDKSGDELREIKSNIDELLK